MFPSKTDHSFSSLGYSGSSKRYIYYNRYKAKSSTDGRFHWHEALHQIRIVMSLIVVGSVMIIVGGVFPLLLSYDLFFKSLLSRECISCVVLGAKPYFEFDYIMATVLAVAGFMMPIFVIFILIRIIRSRSFRHELFD